MKSDAEIKEWIDAKDVLTHKELCRFIFDINITEIPSQYLRTSARHWLYALKTKNAKAMREYKNHKINNGARNTERYEQLKKIFLTDLRFKEAGSRTGTRLLKQIYNINLPRNTYIKTKQEIYVK